MKKKDLLTQGEYNQLLSYIYNRNREGWYCGNKEQFETRQKKILEKLKNLKHDK